MLRLTDLKLPLDHADADLAAAVLERLRIAPQDLRGYSVFRRAVDARKRSAIALIYALDVDVRNEAAVLARSKGDRNLSVAPDLSYRFVSQAPAAPVSRPVVIGTGPCGLFAGLILAQMGFRPILLERGKVVRERTKDTWGLWRRRELNPESNVQFGEGGAGTFSDGKLHSQIKDPHHYGRKVLTEFVKAGAPPEILYRRQAACRHLPAGDRRGKHPPHDRGSRRRVPLWQQGRRPRDRRAAGRRPPGRGRDAGRRHADRDRPCRAGDRPQRARHVPDAGGARGGDRAQAVLDRRAHRASAVAHRCLPLRHIRRPRPAGRGRLQARASQHERPLGLQLLHVPRRHRGGRGLGAGRASSPTA